MAKAENDLSQLLMEKPIVVQLDGPTEPSSTRELQFLLSSILTVLWGRDKRPVPN